MLKLWVLGEITKKIRWPLGKTFKENPKIPLTLEAFLYMAHILVYNLLKKKDNVNDEEEPKGIPKKLMRLKGCRNKQEGIS